MEEPSKLNIQIGGVYYFREPRPNTFQMRTRSVLVVGESSDGKEWLCCEAEAGTDVYVNSEYEINKRSRLMRKTWPKKRIRVYDSKEDAEWREKT